MSDEPLVTTPEDVEESLQEIKDQCETILTLMDFVRDASLIIEGVAERVTGSTTAIPRELFIDIGVLAIECLQDEFSESNFIQLLLMKHKKYGPVCIRKWGLIGIIIRMDTKIERMRNMITNGLGDTEESVFDSLQDVLGYSILALRIIDLGE